MRSNFYNNLRLAVGGDSAESLLRQQELAARLQCPLFQFTGEADFVLWFTSTHLELRQHPLDRHGVYVDFSSGELRHRLKTSKKSDPFCKALGVGQITSVLDATCGLASDSFVIASMGISVVAVERSPVLYELVADGLARGRRDQKICEIIARIELLHGEARDVLQSWSSERPLEVVYFDPMFPPGKGSALPKKEMQVLQKLLPSGSVGEESAFVDLALTKASKRVVVKRPAKAASLANGVTHSFVGRSVRFDFYSQSGR